MGRSVDLASVQAINLEFGISPSHKFQTVENLVFVLRLWVPTPTLARIENVAKQKRS